MNTFHSTESVDHYTPSDIVEAAREVMKGIDLDPASCAEANTQLVKADHFFDEASNGFTRSWAPLRGTRGTVFLNPPGGFCDRQGRRVVKASTKAGVKVPDCTVTGACGQSPGHTHDGCLSSAKEWWFKLAHEYWKGNVLEAVFIAFSLEMLQTTQVNTPIFHVESDDADRMSTPAIVPLDCAICFPPSRIAYLKPTPGGLVVGDSPTHSTCIVYLSRADVGQAVKVGNRRFKEIFERRKIGRVIGV